MSQGVEGRSIATPGVSVKRRPGRKRRRTDPPAARGVALRRPEESPRPTGPRVRRLSPARGARGPGSARPRVVRGGTRSSTPRARSRTPRAPARRALGGGERSSPARPRERQVRRERAPRVGEVEARREQAVDEPALQRREPPRGVFDLAHAGPQDARARPLREASPAGHDELGRRAAGDRVCDRALELVQPLLGRLPRGRPASGARAPPGSGAARPRARSAPPRPARPARPPARAAARGRRRRGASPSPGAGRQTETIERSSS